jgi:hypothetical protein
MKIKGLFFDENILKNCWTIGRMKKPLAQINHQHDQKLSRLKNSSKNEYGQSHVTNNHMQLQVQWSQMTRFLLLIRIKRLIGHIVLSNVEAFQKSTPNACTTSNLNYIFLASSSSTTLKHIFLSRIEPT